MFLLWHLNYHFHILVTMYEDVGTKRLSTYSFKIKLAGMLERGRVLKEQMTSVCSSQVEGKKHCIWICYIFSFVGIRGIAKEKKLKTRIKIDLLFGR